MKKCFRCDVLLWAIFGLLCSLLDAENAYGDEGIVFIAWNARFDEKFRNIIVAPGTPVDFDNETNGFNFESGFRRPLSCGVDYHRNEVYLYDYYLRGMLLMENFNSSAIKDSITISRQHYGISRDYAVKIAVDWLSHNVYWTDPAMNWIAMQPGGSINDQTRYKIIVHLNVNSPRGLAIDPLAGYLFWADVGRNQVIERSSLLGEARRILIHSQLISPESMVADPAARKIYWTDQQFIDSATYDGTERMHVIRDNNVRYFDVAIFQDVIVTTDVYNFLARGSPHYARFYNKTTGKELENKRIAVSDEILFGLCLYNGDLQTAKPERDRCKTAGCQDMCVNEPTKATCVCREGFVLDADGKSCKEEGGQHQRAVVINTGTDLCLLDIRILSDHHNFTAKCFYNGSSHENISSIAVDMNDREVFFAINNTIYRINIDGSSQSRRMLAGHSVSIIDMTLDYGRDRLYYGVASSPPQIWFVDLSTGTPSLQHTVYQGNLRSLTVVPEQNKIFWLAGVSLLQSVDLGGREVPVSNVTLDIRLTNPRRMVYDKKYEKLYVSVDGIVHHSDLMGILFNGSVTQYFTTDYEIVDFTVYKEYLLLVNLLNGKYVVRSADLGLGTPLQVVDEGSITGADTILDLEVLDSSLQNNITNPCSSNGGCEHICLINGTGVVCRCKLGFTLAADGKTCFSGPVQDNFLLVTDVTYMEIMQIPLDQPSQVIGIQTPDIGRPDGVIYNHLTGEVAWSNSIRAEMWAVSRNGTMEHMFANIRALLAYPDRLALDPSTGNIYYTGVSYYSDKLYDSHIGVVNTRGDISVIMWEGHRPRDIALDPAAGYMFWTDYGTEAVGIYRANMDGTDQIRLFSEDVVWPNGIALDHIEKRIYWADGYLDKIYTSGYNGTGRQVFMEVDAGFRLMDIDLSGDYLYFTGMDSQQVTRVHKRNKDVTLIGPPNGLGRLYGLDVYVSTASTNTPVNADCAKENGGCSHFCLPRSDGYTCGCLWSATLLQDQKTCDNAYLCPMNVANGEVVSGPTCVGATGNTCKFKCDSGYRPRAGVHSVTCTSRLNVDNQLMWDIADPCELISCSSTLEHGTVDRACRMTPGSVCNYACDQGYLKTGDSDTVSCLADGTWDRTSTCKEIKCPDSIANGSLPASCSLLPEVVCAYNCNEGYAPDPDMSHIMCEQNGTWDFVNADKILCTQIKCPGTISNGSLSASCSLLPEVVCAYSCDSGFVPDPDKSYIVCQQNGNWDFASANKRLCKPKSSSMPAASAGIDKVAVGVGVGVGLLLVVIIAVIIFFLIRRGKIPSPAGRSEDQDTSVTFENPRYGDNGIRMGATDSGVGYTTLQEEKLGASSTNTTYDNNIPRN